MPHCQQTSKTKTLNAQKPLQKIFQECYDWKSVEFIHEKNKIAFSFLRENLTIFLGIVNVYNWHFCC